MSTEGLLEYEEVAAREMDTAAAGNLMRFIELLEQTRSSLRHVSPTFRFDVITADPDDNKFTDCAITAGADYIVTEDRHFTDNPGDSRHSPISKGPFRRARQTCGPPPTAQKLFRFAEIV